MIGRGLGLCFAVGAIFQLAAGDARAEAEMLTVDFDLAQYTQTGTFSFSQGCTTSPATGRKNYTHLTVVWIEDANGAYVTTLHRWGRTYVYNLKTWALSSNMAIDGVTESTPTSDAVIGSASPPGYPGQVFKQFSTTATDISWLPDGDYKIRFETTQCELAGEYRSGLVDLWGPEASFSFTKGRTSQTNQNLGSTAPFNNVVANYTPAAGNAHPSVLAGADQWLMPSVTPAQATTTLSATVSDDSGSAPNVSWTQVSAQPSTATLMANIASPGAATTDVTFTSAGIYTFRSTATDGGGLSASDDVTVYVNATTLELTDDAEVARGQASGKMGIIDNFGPWVFSWGKCAANGPNFSRGYLRFDASGLTSSPIWAQIRLPWGEGASDPTAYHDFYLLDDAQDDWTGTGAGTDWEAEITFSNQPVTYDNNGLPTNLDNEQLLGSFQHSACRWRHGFSDPALGPNPASECPTWVTANLDLTQLSTYDSNNEWSFLMAPRKGCGGGMGVASRENLIDGEMIVVQHWQDAPNVAPVADAGTYSIVVDTAPTGSEFVTLNGSGSSDDSGVTSYAWRDGAVSLGSNANPMGVSASLALGIHDIALEVTDGGGLTDTDTTQIIVEDRFNAQSRGTRAMVDGTPTGKLYDDLFAYSASTDGDWFQIDLVAGSSLDVSVTMDGGDLDVSLFDDNQVLLDASSTAALTETVSAVDLPAGSYSIQIEAASGGDSTYSMTVTVTGPTLVVTLNQASAVETAGTLSGAGTVSVQAAPSSPLTVDLTSEFPNQLSFGSNPITIAAGSTSANFDITLVDDPAGVADAARTVNISATAAGYNSGSLTFEIFDNEASIIAVWDKASETVAETSSPLVVLTAMLSSTPSASADIPFTLSGTATLDADYEIIGGQSSLTINGAASATLVISLLDDAEEELDETLIVTMGAPTGATLGALSVYTLTISDDDGTGTNPNIPNDPDQSLNGGCACGAGGSSASLIGLGGWMLALGWARRRKRRAAK